VLSGSVNEKLAPVPRPASNFPWKWAENGASRNLVPEILPRLPRWWAREGLQIKGFMGFRGGDVP